MPPIFEIDVFLVSGCLPTFAPDFKIEDGSSSLTETSPDFRSGFSASVAAPITVPAFQTIKTVLEQWIYNVTSKYRAETAVFRSAREWPVVMASDIIISHLFVLSPGIQ
jgi:hypothetical protein